MSADASSQAAKIRFLLARAWHSKGTLAAAIAGYREVLALDPHHAEAAVLLGALMESQMRMEEAREVYQRTLEHCPDDSRLHKQFVRVLQAQEGTEAVLHHYRLQRKDAKPLHPRPGEILGCVALRNELPRLPYFLTYYRSKGIGAFLAVDNGSTDGSLEYLLEQRDVYLWQSDLSFRKANFGAGWFEPLLRLYGRDRWCLIVDADELLYYPDCERSSIQDLCRCLDQQGKRAFPAVHLDLYSSLPLQDTHYTPGQPFEEVCPYFDRDFFHTRKDHAGPYRNLTMYWGGVRQRIFGESAYCLSKVPLLKYDDDCILSGGQHWTNLPAERIAAARGCLLHFKYFSSFPALVAQEVRRKEHANQAMLYSEYERGLREQPSLTFYDPAHSLRLENSQQLVRLGVMKADEEAACGPVVFPTIDPVPGRRRPMWSVMLTVHRRLGYLEQALRSVLAQSPGPLEMQIEVVSDGPDDSVQEELEARVHALAGDRVCFYRHLEHAGQPEIFNVCLRRARGAWVHILHDDDWVAPGFYRALHRGISQVPGLGAAFCRQNYVDESGQRLQLSFLERETPGLLEGWLDRIACSCRLQTPGIAVCRAAYERCGGYCPQAKSAFDWEMWQRLAASYRVWYDPQPLAFFRISSESESARLMPSGRQIADSRGVIEIARSYLPELKRDAYSRRAGGNLARRAIELARMQVEAGNLSGALALLREGLQCSQPDESAQNLIQFLRNA